MTWGVPLGGGWRYAASLAGSTAMCQSATVRSAAPDDAHEV